MAQFLQTLAGHADGIRLFHGLAGRLSFFATEASEVNACVGATHDGRQAIEALQKALAGGDVKDAESDSKTLEAVSEALATLDTALSRCFPENFQFEKRLKECQHVRRVAKRTEKMNMALL